MTQKLSQFQQAVALKLAELQEMFEESGIPLSRLTLIARNPDNEGMTVLLTNEPPNEIDEAFQWAKSVQGDKE